MTGAIHLCAYAKINWGLEILGRRPDGFHAIRTVTQTVSLCDEIRLSPIGDDISLRVTGPWPVPETPDNIAWKTARAFRTRLGGPRGVRIEIEKRIPVGAGLGGGSSDCVAVLAGLARMTGRGAPGDLEQMAAELGSDTVLFLRGGAALCSGRGEIVDPIPAPRKYNMVIARPDCSVSTAEAYRSLTPGDFTDGAAMDAVAAALARSREPAGFPGFLRNAFARPVIARRPQIAQLLAKIEELGLPAAQMTGSGSAVFGLADSSQQAGAVADMLCENGYWAQAAHTVDRGFELLEMVNDG